MSVKLMCFAQQQLKERFVGVDCGGVLKTNLSTNNYKPGLSKLQKLLRSFLFLNDSMITRIHSITAVLSIRLCTF